MFHYLRSAALVTALFASSAGSAFAQDAAQYGNTAQVAQATRSIDITDKTTSIRVDEGETVEIRANGKSFTWHFSTKGLTSFELAKLVPAGMLKHKVMVYVSPNPLYQG